MVHLLDINIKIVLQFLRNIVNSSEHKHKVRWTMHNYSLRDVLLDISNTEPIKTFEMNHKSTKC
jgi:hypothetical protein